ncbi:hypothetical protein Tco_0979720 [Tanacetum coccineum]
MAREAWGLSMDASDYARSDVMSLHTTVVAHSALILELQSANHRRQGVIKELLAADHQRQIQLTKALKLLKGLQTQMKMAPKRKTTRLNPDATPTPVTNTYTTTSVTNAQIQAMINKGVTALLAARDATKNGDDSHTSGTGARRPVQVARECTYLDFLKCQPLNFKGTEGVVGLTQWFEKMESVYSISNCTVACQLPRYAIEDMKKMDDRQIQPSGEVRTGVNMWNLKVEGYTMCRRQFIPNLSKKLEDTFHVRSRTISYHNLPPKDYADVEEVGPFKVLEQVKSVAYKLKLPQELSRVYNMFYVSNLKKYYPDDPLVVPLEGLHVDEKLHFVEKPVEIMD